LWCGLLFASESILFGSLSLDSSFTGSLDLGTFGVHLILESLLTLLLGLSFVDLLYELVYMIYDSYGTYTYVFDEGTLVLECVTLTLLV